MAIIVDPLFSGEGRYHGSQTAQAEAVGRRTGHQWCHMWCESGEEDQLHEIAAKIGMKRAWFQDKKNFPHYDLVEPKRSAAVRAGAVETDLKEWLKQRKTK